MPRPHGFPYRRRGDGAVASPMAHAPPPSRAGSAPRGPWRVEHGDAQRFMARRTGDHRRGDERAARGHPRNQG
ncbi:hypothetical protein [Actinacidiphila sp. bgisy167]|uniref:hypothetical protein n=1 Tax=Actinacidiphila sp. bgisy167 TaxID=3413797 RepID=UPI003D70B160